MTETVLNLRDTPMRVGRVRLNVRDLGRVSEFYQATLGLVALDQRPGHAVLGTATTPLLDLHGDASLAPRNPRHAGLFHTAFLLPSRASLGAWLAHALETGVRLQGASDHVVSEAVYLDDPEGNGIEVYADRPPSHWRRSDGSIAMSTDPLDGEGLLAAGAGTRWTDFPDAGCIGHVHLQVGDTGRADAFYRDVLGFDIASRYPGASFYGSGGYHHQLAGNRWNSANAPMRPDRAAGLDRVEILVRDPADQRAILDRATDAGLDIDRSGENPAIADPWGTLISLAPGQGETSCS